MFGIRDDGTPWVSLVLLEISTRILLDETGTPCMARCTIRARDSSSWTKSRSFSRSDQRRSSYIFLCRGNSRYFCGHGKAVGLVPLDSNVRETNLASQMAKAAFHTIMSSNIRNTHPLSVFSVGPRQRTGGFRISQATLTTLEVSSVPQSSIRLSQKDAPLNSAAVPVRALITTCDRSRTQPRSRGDRILEADLHMIGSEYRK
jgi:hypothetical protein